MNSEAMRALLDLTAVLLTLYIGSSRAQLPIRADNDAGPPGPLCPPSCVHAPPRAICGSNGVTYRSQCHLAMANCQGHRVILRHWGECVQDPNGSVCLQRREETLAAHSGAPSENIFVPQCDSDGTYAEVQCHRGAGYCWCVDDQGNAVFGTAVQNSRPECSARSPRTSKTGGRSGRRRNRNNGRRRRGRCGGRTRTLFQDSLMRMIKLEYNQLHRGILTPNLERTAAEWKFTQLDRDSSGDVDRREVRRLRRKARKALSPSVCARRFHRYCDKNSSRTLDLQEWLLCVGVDRENISFRLLVALNEEMQGSDEASDASVTSQPDSRRASQPAAVPAGGSFSHGMPLREDTTTEGPAAQELEPSCQADRRQALENQRMAQSEGRFNNGFFIPTCTADNKFTNIQCHNATGYCWCVEIDTGKTLPGTSVRHQIPDCTKASPASFSGRRGSQRRVRLPKACREGQRLQTFLRELLDYLTTKLVLALKRQEYSLPSNSAETFEEKIAKWKFHTTDRNGNSKLDRREWRALRREFSQASAPPLLRRCGKRLPRYCDSDSDRKISIDEWLVCLGAVKEQRRRQNPLAILKSE